MTDPTLRLAYDYSEDSSLSGNPLFRDVTWSPDSQRLIVLTLHHGLFVLEQPDFEPICIVKELYAFSMRHGWQAAWIP